MQCCATVRATYRKQQTPNFEGQGAKKAIFTAYHSGKLKLTFTGPNIISASPKNVLMSRLISQFCCNLNFSKNLTCLLGKLITEFSSPIAKSTSPGLSDTTFFARWGDRGGVWILFSAEVTLFEYNFVAVCRCPRYIQSVFNLIVDILMDIHVMVNWQLSKRVSTDQCHLTVSQVQVYTTHWGDIFFRLSADQLLVLIHRRLRSIMKRVYKE